MTRAKTGTGATMSACAHAPNENVCAHAPNENVRLDEYFHGIR
jgi:acetylornithine deacetylase/succinyl-diaminopimelate desuccinylase-like protein